MTREELTKNLEAVRDRRFMNNMEDHWSDYNFKIDRECADQIRLLEKALAELDG